MLTTFLRNVAKSTAVVEGLTQAPAIAKALCATETSAHLLGKSAVAQAAVTHWLHAVDTEAAASEKLLKELEETLKFSSYIGGPSFTIADAAVYAKVHPLVPAKLKGLPAVTRWLRQILSNELKGVEGQPEPVPVLPAAAPASKLLTGEAAGAAGGAGAEPAKKEKKEKPAKQEGEKKEGECVGGWGGGGEEEACVAN